MRRDLGCGSKCWPKQVPDVAAAKLAAMPLPQIVAGLAHHVLVFDVSAVAAYETD